MVEGITQSGIMIAGVGTRTQELYHPGEPEKGWLYLAQPDFSSPHDEGVRLIHLIIANHLLGLPDLQKVTLLVSPNSQMPEKLGASLDTERLLRRQGRADLAPSSMASEIELDYAVQELQTKKHPEYGTAWAAHLLIARVDVDPDERILISTGDDLLFDPEGSSAIAEMTAMLANNGEKATAAMQVTAVPTDQEILYGAVRSEFIGGVQYLMDVVENEGPRESFELPDQKIELDKNISTYIVDAEFMELNEQIAKTPPPPINKGERRITDTLNGNTEFTGRRLLVARASDKFMYLDFGKAANIRWYRSHEFVGLRNGLSPRWGSRPRPY